MLDVLVDELSDPESFISVIVRILHSILNIDLSNSPHHNGIAVKNVIFYPFSNPVYLNNTRNEGGSATRFLSRLLMPYMLLTQ